MYDLLFKNFARYVTLTDDEKNIVMEVFRFKKYRRRQYLLQEGDVCKNQFFVLKGALRLYQVSDDGKEHIIQFAFEDWFIADVISYFSNTPADYCIDALEDSEVLCLDKNSLDELFEKIPKLERFFRIVFQNALITSQWRHTIMQKSAEERYAYLQKKFPFFEQRVSQQHIASYLGLTRETLSRIRGTK